MLTCSTNVNPLNFNAPVSFGSVTDGLSNTVVFGEYVKGRGSLGPDGLHMIYGLTDAQECDVNGAPNPDAMLNEMCHASKLLLDGRKGWQWMRVAIGRGGGYNHSMSPNRKACAFGSVGSQLYELIGVSSNHPGGVNMAFMDGSVKFVKTTINYNAWLAIGTMAGGEVISADAL